MYRTRKAVKTLIRMMGLMMGQQRSTHCLHHSHEDEVQAHSFNETLDRNTLCGSKVFPAEKQVKEAAFGHLMIIN